MQISPRVQVILSVNVSTHPTLSSRSRTIISTIPETLRLLPTAYAVAAWSSVVFTGLRSKSNPLRLYVATATAVAAAAKVAAAEAVAAVTAAAAAAAAKVAAAEAVAAVTAVAAAAAEAAAAAAVAFHRTVSSCPLRLIVVGGS